MIVKRINHRPFANVRRYFASIIACVVIGFLPGAAVIAQQNYDPSKVDLTGDWAGTITHGRDRYSYTYDYVLRLKQVGARVSGNSNATAGNVAVSFDVRGQYSNNKLTAKDGQMLTHQDGSPNDLWCVKSMELQVIQASPLRLEGTWKSQSRFDVFNPLGSINPHSPAQCAGGTIKLFKENLPTPFTETFGTVAYYEFRNDDYIKRNPQKSPPTYYLQFGRKNLVMFLTTLYPEVSPAGQAFLTKVATILQKKIEDRLVSGPKTFAQMEDNSDEFLAFAYSTHYPAYCEAGWDALSYNDQLRIFHAIDFLDKFNRNGIPAGAKILFTCSDYKKPPEPQKSNPVKDKVKNIWNQIKKP